RATLCQKCSLNLFAFFLGFNMEIFSSRSRDKNPYNPAKKPIAIFKENDFPVCYFSMCKGIGESRKVDNPT
ncbi:hypothetical protein, partial [Leeuwenhoekiella marinoflava]|uniref:hypothetical protein n=1 Tax=Leeuwenhoekiella marinoflava TaxID=988 RepID=UPI00300285C4